MSAMITAVVGGAIISGVAANNAAKTNAKATKAAAGAVSDASIYSADLQYKLGAEELAFNKEQFDYSKGVSDKVVNAQLATMDETNRQAKDYYDYMVANQRPVESALNAEAMASGGAADQEAAATRAGADTQAGIDAARAQKLRVMSSMGVNPNSGRFASTGQSDSVAEGAVMAGAKNNARETAKNLGYAKKLDVAGLYRGLSGASQGAYSTALSAGNSAVGNANATGAMGMNGVASANNTTIGGANTAMQGATTLAQIYQNSKTDSQPWNQFLSKTGGALMSYGMGGM